MKTRLLIIIVGILVLTVIPISLSMVIYAYAAPEPDPEHAFNYSEIVVIGKILDVRIFSQPILNEGANKAGIAVYDVLVIDALKNAEVEEIITVPGLFFDEYDPIDTIGLVYEIDDVVILYIQENHKEWNPDDLIIRPNESKKLFNCDEAITNQIPVHQKYYCWHEPMGHPLRDISLSKGDDLERLEFIEKHCQNKEFREYFGKLRYVNSTHLIDLDTCEWKKRSNSSVSLDRTVYSQPYSGDSRSDWEIAFNDLNNWIREQLSYVIGHIQNLGSGIKSDISPLESEPSSFCDDVKKLSDRPWHCPGITTPTKLTKLSSAGFDICDIDGYEYYVLSKGQTGTITYEIHRGFDLNDPPVADEQVEIIKDNPSFISQPDEYSRQSFLPDGISVTYDPQSLMLGFNQSATIIATVSVDDTAQNDTFWLGLSPYTCFGGWHQKFAVVGN